MVVSTMTPDRGESGIPHHPVSFKSRREGLTDIGMCNDTGAGAEPRVSEEVIWGNGWYCGGAVAAALSTVISGERSTRTHFVRVFLPFP